MNTFAVIIAIAVYPLATFALCALVISVGCFIARLGESHAR